MILSIKAKTDSTIISEIYMIWIANFVSKYFSTSYFHILLFIYLNISTPNPLTLYSSSPLFAAWSPGLTVGASSVGSIFSVKKGRLFERSEFLPFSWKCYRSSPGSAALSFSFGIFSLVSRQKKNTPTSIIHIKKIRIFCPFLLYIS